MLVSQKCQYALRASFELAKRASQAASSSAGLGQPASPVKIADIAEAQAIPLRFLEVILPQLKQGGFVASQRGSDGGYFMVKDPRQVTVGHIIRFMQGPLGPIGCVADPHRENCPLYGDCVFFPMWDRAKQAIENVYDGTTLADLVEQDRLRKRPIPLPSQEPSSYCI